MIFGWLRPLSRDFWKLVPSWRDWHRFMSTQSLTLGGTILSVAIYLQWPKSTLLTILGVTVFVTLLGSLIEQPEIDSAK